MWYARGHAMGHAMWPVRADLLELLDVPNLDLVVGGADGHVVALADPRERGDVRLLSLRLHELLDGAVARVPQVDRVAQGDAQHVVLAPVEQVEICPNKSAASGSAERTGCG